MNKYLLVCDKLDDEHFEAKDDEAAEQWVEENYEQDDGAMQLFRLTPVTSWS